MQLRPGTEAFVRFGWAHGVLQGTTSASRTIIVGVAQRAPARFSPAPPKLALPRRAPSLERPPPPFPRNPSKPAKPPGRPRTTPVHPRAPARSSTDQHRAKTLSPARAGIELCLLPNDDTCWPPPNSHPRLSKNKFIIMYSGKRLRRFSIGLRKVQKKNKQTNQIYKIKQFSPAPLFLPFFNSHQIVSKGKNQPVYHRF